MILTVNNLKKIIDKKIILNNISFTIDRNEIITLLGSSGAGKSTQLKC